MKESEGELSMNDAQQQQKKSASDFALWKSSKPGEPFWASPWGKGRPGWHIECSAMCTKVCGETLDIHGGGSDLKFPHHDNEIAQCEAYFDCKRWVNYFLHCGTLRIAGSKMSKSLKNFISINQALETYTARQLRILFLMSNWTDILDYSPSTMERATQFEKLARDFFLLVKDLVHKHFKPDSPEGFPKFENEELELNNKFEEKKGEIREALCDSIDTRTVIEKIRALIKLGNAYVKEKEDNKATPNCVLLFSMAEYMTWLLKVFGYSDSEGECDKMELLMPYLQALSQFRECTEKRHCEQRESNFEALR
ncbi:hypothetical protein L596_004191 [Steinernema carpocapsae]|uniref:Cysteine--tRNA ligase, cytoplasmic n=1 Tax=Steinernema carpocapsae TaxID=34508 RepID=A0A4U8UW20_STECR|nr:hypothetical protein L596_004191 [Steinernema carpocapsae]